MQARKKILLVTGLCLVAVCLALLTTNRREPSWEGRSLKQWMAFGFSTGTTHGQHDYDETVEAIQHMGEAALSYLVSELGVKDSRFKRCLGELSWRQRLVPVYYVPAYERRSRAVHGLEALGSMAKPAVPAIQRYLRDADPEFVETAQCALDAIRQAGTD